MANMDDQQFLPVLMPKCSKKKPSATVSGALPYDDQRQWRGCMCPKNGGKVRPT